MQNPLLSICIPTYNQPREVKRLFESLLPQITPEVEIVVRDDSSNSETEKIIREYQRKVPIRYVRGEKEGLDKAIIFLTQEAKGKYVWWLGDDILAKGAVEGILKLVRQHPDIDFVCVNSCGLGGTEPVLRIGGDKFFRDKNQVLEEVVDLLGFISVTIFRREKALSGIRSSEKHIGSAWVCLYLILHVLSQNGRFYYVSHPYVLSSPRSPEKPAWYDGFKVFAVNFFYIVQEFQGKFDKKSIKRALADNFKGIWRGILVYRAKGYTTGLGSHDPKLPVLFKLYWNFAEFWLAFPFLLMPRRADRLLYKAYKAMRRK